MKPNEFLENELRVWYHINGLEHFFAIIFLRIYRYHDSRSNWRIFWLSTFTSLVSSVFTGR